MQAQIELLGRYARVLCLSWKARHQLTPVQRQPLERQFLPAALEITETPAPALAHAVLWTIIVAAGVALLWGFLGRVDTVAVAQGKVIASGKAKVVQPAETAVVKRIHVTDGQAVKAGQTLIELELAGSAADAETARNREALLASRLESARYAALARIAGDTAGQPVLTAPVDAPAPRIAEESSAMYGEYAEHRAKLAALDAEIAMRHAELAAARQLAGKLAQTTPIAQRRAHDYKDLADRNFVSQHGYLEREQDRIEHEGDLAVQQAKVKELAAAIEEAKRRRQSNVAEFSRAATNAKVEADKRAAQLEYELTKAQTRERQQILTAPVDGTVQQLAVHTEGGVVTEAQTLMVIAPSDYQAEIEATLENKDVGFVKVGQRAEVKIETFPFTRYGTIPGTVTFVSNDAVADEKKGLLFQSRVKLDRPDLQVDERRVKLTPGMAVTAEIVTGDRRLIAYFFEPLKKTTTESLRER